MGFLVGAVGLTGFTLILVELLSTVPPEYGIRLNRYVLSSVAEGAQILPGGILGACTGWAFIQLKSRDIESACNACFSGGGCVTIQWQFEGIPERLSYFDAVVGHSSGGCLTSASLGIAA
jgi:hypothetical protein